MKLVNGITPLDIKDESLHVRLLRKLGDVINNLGDRLSAVEKLPPPIPPEELRAQLSAGGKLPLNVGSLQGVLARPQLAKILTYTTKPTGAPLQALNDGQLISVSGTPYTFYQVIGGNPNTLTQLSTAPANYVTTDSVQNIGPSAAKTFLDLATFSAMADLAGANGSKLRHGFSTDLTTVAGATTDTATNVLPTFCLLKGIVFYVTTTITGCVSVNVGDTTTAARFGSLGSLAAGSGLVAMNHLKGGVSTDATGPTQITADKIRFTAVGGGASFTAGQIRTVVFYEQYSVPTS